MSHGRRVPLNDNAPFFWGGGGVHKLASSGDRVRVSVVGEGKARSEGTPAATGETGLCRQFVAAKAQFVFACRRQNKMSLTANAEQRAPPLSELKPAARR